MIDNYPLLTEMLTTGRIRMEDAPFLHAAPLPLPASFNFDRIEGMLLGLAIGDSLGNTSEGMLPAQRQREGDIRDYDQNPYANWRRVGTPSDDTQLAFWTLEQLLEDDGLVPEHLAERFCRGRIFGIGSTVSEFLREFNDRGVPWSEAGQASAGNGALMRIAPLVVPHLGAPSPSLWADAALAGMVTHNDYASNACCVAFVHLLWRCLSLERAPGPSWWLENFVPVMEALEGETTYVPRVPSLRYQGPMARFAAIHVGQALDEGWSVLKACNTWHSGAFLLETIPSALYILARHADDAEEAIVRAVNDTRDNDTVAAIVGAAIGALHGARALPQRWREGLLGRTQAADDGRVQELIAAARGTWA